MLSFGKTMKINYEQISWLKLISIIDGTFFVILIIESNM